MLTKWDESPSPTAPPSPDACAPPDAAMCASASPEQSPQSLPAYFLLPWPSHPNPVWEWIHTSILSLLPPELGHRERGLRQQLCFELNGGNDVADGNDSWSEANQSFFSCLRNSHLTNEHNPYLPRHHAPGQSSAPPSQQATALWCIESMAIDVVMMCRRLAVKETVKEGSSKGIIGRCLCLRGIGLTWAPHALALAGLASLTLSPSSHTTNDLLSTLPSEMADLFQLLHTMKVSIDHLRRGSMCTQRDLYYSWPALFGGSQQGAERSIGRLCALLEHQEGVACGIARSFFEGTDVPVFSLSGRTFKREDLGIGASAKSLVAGCLQYTLPSPSGAHVVDVGAMREQCALITTEVGLYSCEFRMHRLPEERVVFIVEKEATLHSLLYRDRVLQLYPGAVLICSKGYPCVAARSFLGRFLSEIHTWEGPSIPIFFVMDGDPDGIGIMLSYLGALLPPVPKKPTSSKRTKPSGGQEDHHTSTLQTMLARFHNETVFGHRCSVNLRWLGLRPTTVGTLLDLHSHIIHGRDTPITDAYLSRLLRGMMFQGSATGPATLPIGSIRGRGESRLRGVHQECKDLVVRAEDVLMRYIRSCDDSGMHVDSEPSEPLPPSVGIALTILHLLMGEVLREVEHMSSHRNCAELQIVETVAQTLEGCGPPGSPLYTTLGLLLELDATT